MIVLKRDNPLVEAAGLGRVSLATNAYGRSVSLARYKPAGDWYDDAVAQNNALFGGSGSSNSGSTLSDSDFAEIARSAGVSAAVPDETRGLTANQLTDNQRARIAAQNQAIINLASRAVESTGAAITAAIQSGNQVQIAQIAADSRVATARLLAEAAEARRRGDEALARERATEAANAAALHQITAPLAGQQQGLSTTTMVLIGLGVAAAGVGLYFATRGGGRRNNPVMIKKGRRKYFNSRERARAERHGWRKAR